MTLFLVMVGAAVGAASRWMLDQAVRARWDRVFPLGTVTINVAGSGLLGALLALAAGGHTTAVVVSLAGTGFCGGFTTYSTFGFETVRLAQDGAHRDAVLNVILSLGLGLGACLGGWYLAK